MRELVEQLRTIGDGAREILADPAADALTLDRNVAATIRSDEFPTAQFGAPLGASLIPWIDRALPSGETREEWRGHVESNKILGNDPEIPVDGLWCGSAPCGATARRSPSSSSGTSRCRCSRP
jgi:aspartate-semialdehyde dehydrogenase